ncbi:hypothetical protein KY363_00435 [Candidatus Woesearchaeota archaeon]|nr:hypothetical protein [Candidatus Woesearchaeota archaeon]
MRKAQVAGQIFIYILAVVVVGLIIAYGYSAIKGFTEKGKQVEYITLKTTIENSVKGMVSDYGSIKRPDISVPGKYTMVCFVDRSRSGDASSTAMCTSTSGAEEYFEPVACSGWQTGRDDVFLIPDGSESFSVGATLEITNTGKAYSGQPFICFEVVNNKIKLQLESKGDRVVVSEYS